MSEPDPTGRQVPIVTAARLTSNTGVRLWGPLVPQLASGFGVSTAAVGVALSAGEFAGLLAPAIGSRVDRSRTSVVMAVGLTALAAGALVVASAPTIVVLGAALVVVSASKVLYDTAMGTWIAERVPYERRARVVGVTETSWALSLLVIVPLLLLLAAATSWRWAVVGVAGLNLAAAAVVHTTLRDLDSGPARRSDRQPVRLRAVLGAWPLFAGVALLMTASQFVFVTFSSWLQDDHGLSTAGVSAVSFLLGGVELLASGATIVVTDRIGKLAAAALGMAGMVPGATALAVGGDHLGIGLTGLAVFVVGFEFALVSTLPMVTEVRPDARGASLGLTIGMGTLGRGSATLVATAAYDRWGMVAPSIGMLATTVAAGGVFVAGRHRHGLR